MFNLDEALRNHLAQRQKEPKVRFVAGSVATLSPRSKPGRTREYSARNKQPLSWRPQSMPRGHATDTSPTVRHQGRIEPGGKHDISP